MKDICCNLQGNITRTAKVCITYRQIKWKIQNNNRHINLKKAKKKNEHARCGMNKKIVNLWT